jgi:DNA-binding IscR family transcriptional regulator
MGDEIATAEEMEQFLKPSKPNVIPIKSIENFNADKFVKEWIEKMTKTADNATTQNIFERNMQVLRQEYQNELQQILADLVNNKKIDDAENKLKQQITNRRK